MRNIQDNYTCHRSNGFFFNDLYNDATVNSVLDLLPSLVELAF